MSDARREKTLNQLHDVAKTQLTRVENMEILLGQLQKQMDTVINVLLQMLETKQTTEAKESAVPNQ